MQEGPGVLLDVCEFHFSVTQEIKGEKQHGEAEATCLHMLSNSEELNLASSSRISGMIPV